MSLSLCLCSLVTEVSFELLASIPGQSDSTVGELQLDLFVVSTLGVEVVCVFLPCLFLESDWFELGDGVARKGAAAAGEEQLLREEHEAYEAVFGELACRFFEDEGLLGRGETVAHLVGHGVDGDEDLPVWVSFVDLELHGQSDASGGDPGEQRQVRVQRQLADQVVLEGWVDRGY